MALLSAPPSLRLRGGAPCFPAASRRRSRWLSPSPNPRSLISTREPRPLFHSPDRRCRPGPAASRLCEQGALAVDRSVLVVREALLDEELLAAVRLRVRTFYEFNRSSCGVEDHKRHLTEREFEALKDRIAGKRIGFKRVSCINATLPLSASLCPADELCSACKFSVNGDDRVVVGTLDLNQCLRLADELTGKRPEGIGSDVTRAYLSNVCVAKELHRNGLGYELIAKSKQVVRQWGISDLYVHVAVDNEAAQKLYRRSGFVYENEESAWQARFLGRPRRFLLWADLKHTCLLFMSRRATICLLAMLKHGCNTKMGTCSTSFRAPQWLQS